MWKRVMVLLLTLIPSGYGFFRAICITGCKDDAARGGAAGTAFVLAFVLLSRSYGLETFLKTIRRTEGRPDLSSATPPPNLTDLQLALDRQTKKLNALAGALDKDGADQKILNWFAAFATLIATLVWGFGDLIAAHYIPLARCR